MVVTPAPIASSRPIGKAEAADCISLVEERELSAQSNPSSIPTPQVSVRASTNDVGTLKAAENSKVDAAENYRKRMQLLRDRVSAPTGSELDTATLRKRLDMLQSDHAKLVSAADS